MTLTPMLPRTAAPAGGSDRPVAHISSHRPLVRTLDRARRRDAVTAAGFDAVVVPSARSAEHVAGAAVTADRAGAALLVVCSRDADAGEAVATARRVRPRLSVAAVDLPQGYAHDWLTFVTGRCKPAVRPHLTDTALKRNLGLLVGLLLGWERLLFLDDDVPPVDPVTLATLAGGLDREAMPATGCAFTGFDDNSVVCHAYRLAGGAQDTFLGGGALGVDLRARVPYFPDVYNEDWLYLFALLLRRRRSVGFAGELRQLPYDPFVTPCTAERQEFGDILGEGLARLLHKPQQLSVACRPGYWRNMISLRRQFIRSVQRRLEGRGDDDAQRALKSLEAALAMPEAGWSDELATFVQEWRRDLLGWYRRQATLPRMASLPAAVERLDLVGATDLSACQPAGARRRVLPVAAAMVGPLARPLARPFARLAPAWSR